MVGQREGGSYLSLPEPLPSSASPAQQQHEQQDSPDTAACPQGF